MKINLLIAPYRDAYFHSSFGSAVRDLQFIETLAKLEDVHSIKVINRPVSILERLLLRKVRPKKLTITKVSTYDSTSSDIFGALKGRSWAEDVYAKAINKHLEEDLSEKCINVFLDFLPIGTFKPSQLDGWLYWYDFIDNFKKHNRFTTKEKNLVELKYNFIAENADFITAVSTQCLEVNSPYKATSSQVISNKIFNAKDKSNIIKESEKEYDFGFIGFITDKLDVDFIKVLAKQHTIAIYGQVMDKQIGSELATIKNVSVLGKFSYKDVPNICQTFKVGLLPYLAEKSHDGSPLKLYEYMKYNIPCLTSIDYEITDNRFIRNYNATENLHIDIQEMLDVSGNELISLTIQDEWKLDYILQQVITLLIKIKGEEA